MNLTMLGDCRDVLRFYALAGFKAQTCVTSPPYFGLRDYGVPPSEWPEINSTPAMTCCLGLEPTPQAFIDHMVLVFRGVRDVLADDGTLWLNIGDSYAGSGRGGYPGGKGGLQGTTQGQDGSRSAREVSASQRKNCPTVVGGRVPSDDLKTKDLIGIPWMLAFALRTDGWYLRQDIIWSKPNPMPESVTDRCTKAHEYLFLLSKSGRYYFDSEALAEPVAASTIERLSQPKLGQQRGSDRVPGKTNGPMKAKPPRFGGEKYGGSTAPETRTKSGNEYAGSPGGLRNRRSVWTVATRPYKGAHFATFPPALIEPCILAGSKPGDVVLDPFMGSGTTAAVAVQHGRRYLGAELNPEYESLQTARLAGIT